jgi:D-aminopeptidase
MLTVSFMSVISTSRGYAQDYNVRKYGIKIGIMKPGKLNTITDVPGVKVGQVTIIKGDSARTGVTAIIPHSGNIFQHKVPAAFYAGNGFGKLTGTTEIKELGTIETPIILTNTLNVPIAANAVLTYVLGKKGNKEVRSVNPVVGETNDGYLNAIRKRIITEKDVLQAIKKAKGGKIKQGNAGAGTGTTALGFKGGIGTASRMIDKRDSGYVVGVLAQTNFGGLLKIDGVPVGKILRKKKMTDHHSKPGGSCMMIVATNAPLNARNLRRLAKRAMLGFARAGGTSTNGSGDYVIAFSTAKQVRYSYKSVRSTRTVTVLRNDAMTPLFRATIEAAEEAIINSLFHAQTMTGRDGHTAQGLPVPKVIKMMKQHGRDVYLKH